MEGAHQAANVWVIDERVTWFRWVCQQGPEAGISREGDDDIEVGDGLSDEER